jgi:hypothetical protein
MIDAFTFYMQGYFLAGGHGIEESHTLYITAVAAVSGVRYDYMIERPFFSAGARQANRYHV